MGRYDLVIRNGYVVDPGSKLEGRYDIAVTNGKIEKIAEHIDGTKAANIFDAEGNCVMPGIIDLHTHMSGDFGGCYAHKMVAEVGVTTTLDMAGPIESSVEMAAKFGTGINVACIHMVRGNVTIDGEDPSQGAIRKFLDQALTAGAIGCKILGGHYPLTAEATARVIAAANDRQAYVAFHAGTKNTGSNIEGFLEAVKLADGKALHVAHINSYCRGQVRGALEEANEAVASLDANPNITSESYISPFNGTNGKCSGGIPESNVTKTCLKTGGFAASEQGMAEAILAGWAQVNSPEGGRIVLKSGKEALAEWRANATDMGVSFPVNPFEPRVRIATAKRADGSFVVDALSTDGGGIPRNVIIDTGLSLVKLNGMTLRDFAVKTSLNPAAVLGLKTKGHLGLGMDADITVLNLQTQQATMSFVGGKTVMYKGLVVGRGTNFITTAEGEAAVRSAGLNPVIVNIGESHFYERAKKPQAQ